MEAATAEWTLRGGDREEEEVMDDLTHREEGVDDVGLYGAERFVSDHDEDLLLFLQVDEVTEPRLLRQPERRRRRRWLELRLDSEQLFLHNNTHLEWINYFKYLL